MCDRAIDGCFFCRDGFVKAGQLRGEREKRERGGERETDRKRDREKERGREKERKKG